MTDINTCPSCGENYGSRYHEVAHSADVETASREDLEAAAKILERVYLQGAHDTQTQIIKRLRVMIADLRENVPHLRDFSNGRGNTDRSAYTKAIIDWGAELAALEDRYQDAGAERYRLWNLLRVQP